MIKELRKMRAKGGIERQKANYIAVLQNRGKMKKYFTDKGYIAYDTDEFKNYKATVKLGRPVKMEVSVNE